jgi:hypothetical protein
VSLEPAAPAQPAAPRAELDNALHVLRGNLAKADAFITAAEPLIEQSWRDSENNGDDDSAAAYVAAIASWPPALN